MFSFSTTSEAVNGLGLNHIDNIGTDSKDFFDGDLGGVFPDSFTVSGTPFNYNPADGNLLLSIIVTNQAATIPAFQDMLQADWYSSDGALASRSIVFGPGGTEGYLSNTISLVTTFGVSTPTPTPEPGLLIVVSLRMLGLFTFKRFANRRVIS